MRLCATCLDPVPWRSGCAQCAHYSHHMELGTGELSEPRLRGTHGIFWGTEPPKLDNKGG